MGMTALDLGGYMNDTIMTPSAALSLAQALQFLNDLGGEKVIMIDWTITRVRKRAWQAVNEENDTVYLWDDNKDSHEILKQCVVCNDGFTDADGCDRKHYGCDGDCDCSECVTACTNCSGGGCSSCTGVHQEA